MLLVGIDELGNYHVVAFKQILSLLEEKEALQAQLDLINTKLAGIGSTESAVPATVSVTVAKPPASVPKPVAAGKSKRSPEARAKMAAAQRARWAKKKGVSTVVTVSAAGGAKAAPVAPKRTPLAESIVSILKSAGKAGISVSDVAEKLRSKYAWVA